MQKLIQLVTTQEDWLLRRVVDYAKIHEYTRYTSTLIEAWRISIRSLNAALESVVSSDDTIEPIDLDTQFNETAIDQFSIEEVHKHRSRGITLGMFLGLVKYYRRSYFDLVREQNFDARDEREYLALLERFFDRFEIGYSVEWNSLNANQIADELRDQNRVLTNEKNKYLTIFESLYDPVILLDSNNNIENINQAAAELFQEYDLPGHRYYDQQPADHAFPWLAKEIVGFSQSNEQELVIAKSMQTAHGERHFQVKMKRMQDISEKYRGTVVILNDLTERMKKEEVITLNRAIQKWVNSLVDISHRISSGMDTDEILLIAMESLYNLVQPVAAVLGMWDENSARFSIRYQVTASGPEKIDQSFVPGAGGLEAALSEVDFPIPHDRIEYVYPILLKSNETVIGALWVGRDRNSPFAASDRIVCESLAQQISIAIEHALMTDQLQSAAIVEERARLAREMHDGLSQILGFLSLEMQSLELLVKQGKIDETLGELTRARARIRDAQAEVRENILNLRTALTKDGEVIPFLCEYIREFEAQTGIEVHVDDSARRINLAPISEVQLVRIVQEALTNIRLHADANHVWVNFGQAQGNLRVEIKDDGVGFVETELKKHFGLKSMRERTESVNGRICIESNPGSGTRITLCLPVASQSKQEVANAEAAAS